MSDSINVIFHSPGRSDIGPEIYIHWGRSTIIEDLTAAMPSLRTGDVQFASARFIGWCHHHSPGINGLGCSNLFLPSIPDGEPASITYQRILSELPPDTAKVNVDSWEVELSGHVTRLQAQLAASVDGFSTNDRNA